MTDSIQCKHARTKTHYIEPEINIVRECVDCGMVQDPQHLSTWHFEKPGTNNPGWKKRDDIDHTICMTRAVGFIVKEGDKFITISTITDIDGDVFSQTFTIVKSCITKMTTLTDGPG